MGGWHKDFKMYSQASTCAAFIVHPLSSAWEISLWRQQVEQAIPVIPLSPTILSNSPRGNSGGFSRQLGIIIKYVASRLVMFLLIVTLGNPGVTYRVDNHLCVTVQWVYYCQGCTPLEINGREAGVLTVMGDLEKGEQEVGKLCPCWGTPRQKKRRKELQKKKRPQQQNLGTC